MNAVLDDRPSIVTAQRGEMCYCPGCSHSVILEHLGKAIDRMGLRHDEVCVVSDIGCIGTADKYFDCHTFHGLHGRSITYAEGIKRVHPDMTAIVLIGDGGCGIGTAHLIHAARRGVGIKVIVCNNFNFGMTGGQHSPTTPPCMVTPTTPSGAAEHPFDICQSVIVNGAAHVGRFSAIDAECSERLEALLRAPGFGLLDLWELCVAYFVPENKLKPAAFHEISRRQHLPFGLLHSVERVPTACREVQEGRPTPMNRAGNIAPLQWPRRTEICVAGSAGQRIRSAAGVVGEIAVAAGLFAAQLDDFPITVRKGHSISNLILSDKAIRYTGADDPDLVIFLSAEGVGRLGWLADLKSDGCLIADRNLTVPPNRHIEKRFDLVQVEKRTGKASAALAILAAGLIAAGWIDAPTLLTAADQSLRGKYRADNLRALEIGVSLKLQGNSGKQPTPIDHQEDPP